MLLKRLSAGTLLFLLAVSIPTLSLAEEAITITKTAVCAWNGTDWLERDVLWAHGAVEIKNIPKKAIRINKLVITFIGKNDAVLGITDLYTVAPKIVWPGEIAYAGDSIELEDVKTPQDVLRIDVYVDYEESSDIGKPLSITNLRAIKTAINGIKILGFAQKTSPGNIEGDLHFVIALFDGNDKLLAVQAGDRINVKLKQNDKIGIEANDLPLPANILDNTKKLIGKAYVFEWW